MNSEFYIDQNGVARWKSNKRVIPADCVSPEVLSTPGFNFKATWDTRDKETQETLNAYRQSRAQHGYSSEELAEIRHELGPDAVDVITGKVAWQACCDLRIFGGHAGRPNVTRRKAAAPVLNNIAEKQTVTFPYNGQNFTATVDKINTTTATVTITKVEGRSSNPRQEPILPGAKGVRVPASILARSL